MIFISDYQDSFIQTKIMLFMLMAYPSIHIWLISENSINESHSSLNNIEVLLNYYFEEIIFISKYDLQIKNYLLIYINYN